MTLTSPTASQTLTLTLTNAETELTLQALNNIYTSTGNFQFLSVAQTLASAASLEDFNYGLQSALGINYSSLLAAQSSS